MKLKKLKICLFKTFFLILLLTIIPGVIYAEDGNFDVKKFNNDSVKVDAVDNLVNNSFGTAISVVRIVSFGSATVILLIIACRYMMAAPGDRAEIKKYAVPFVIGAVILFATSGILTIISGIAKNISA